MKGLGIYIHIPFCVSRCKYCDFYSQTDCSPQLQESYIDALCKHIKEYSQQTKEYVVTSVYFGGGTPTLLPTEQIKRLVKCIKKNFRLSLKCEISIEANPGTVDLKSLKQIRKMGINRISIGAQSFEDCELKTCGRVHSSEQIYKAVIDARMAKFDNISLDLIYGLPGQTKQTLGQSIKDAIELEVDHISLYGLKIEQGTPFWYNRKTLSFPDEDTECDMYLDNVQLLKDAGYTQYEISNFAKQSKRCKHNLRYWNGDEYIGFGPAAHSYFGGKRFSFKKDLKLYIDTFDDTKKVSESIIDEYIDIPYTARIAEYVMLRFRLNDGINKEMFRKRFDKKFDDVYYERIKPYIASGHIVQTKNGYAFSLKGMCVSNYILARIVDFDLVIPGTTN